VVLISSVGLAWVAPHACRFHLFGLNGLLLAAVLGAPARWLPAWSVRLAPTVAFVASVPVVMAAGWYSALFWPAALGFQQREEFLRARTALYDVAIWCNRETPPDARFCIDLEFLPRLFYLDRIALSPEGLTGAETAEGGDLLAYMKRNHLDYLLSQRRQPADRGLVLVRKFEGVIVEAYRTPGRAPQRGTVWLYRMARGPS
jgi:hypothetical protein